jgi:hypothetical protein
MNNDRWGRTPDEIDDDAKHFYTESTVSLRAVVDDLSEIAQKVDAKTRLELKRLRAQLVDVYVQIGYHTVFEMDNADTFTDGTPVAIVAGPPSTRGWLAPEDIPEDLYGCGIPWLPITAVNEGYDPDGPIPPGCAVMVVVPPHHRRSKVRAARQEARADSEALKTDLRQAGR